MEHNVPSNITNDTSELVNNVTHNVTLSPEVNQVVQQAVQNLTRSDVGIQMQPNKTYYYLFGKYPANLAVTNWNIWNQNLILVF